MTAHPIRLERGEVTDHDREIGFLCIEGRSGESGWQQLWFGKMRESATAWVMADTIVGLGWCDAVRAVLHTHRAGVLAYSVVLERSREASA